MRVILFLVLFSPSLWAQDMSALIDIAGQQRMLSQRIAKAYLFLGADVRADKARQQLKQSLQKFKQNLEQLNAQVSDQEAKDLLSFVQFSFMEFTELVNQPYSFDHAALIIDLSETLLETSHAIVLRLEKLSKVPKDQIVNLAGRQRMLSQRIAKFYIAYQLGFKDENSVRQLKQAVDLFEKSLLTLMQQKRNTPQIKSKLDRVNGYWKLVRGFFLNIEQGGLPVTVFAATDKITQLMDEVTKLYVQLVTE